MLVMSEKKKPGRRPSPDSKRAKGEDRHAQPRKAFHAPQELFDAMAVYIARTKPQPTDAAVLRLALERFLESEGLWPPKGE
jgi:hypothetical protein